MLLHRISRRSGLGARLTLALSASSLLLTVLLVLIIGVVVTDELKLTIGNGLAERARHATEQLDGTMAERYREVQNLARRAELGSPELSIERKRRILEQLQETYPYYAWIGLTDRKGTVLASTKGLLEGVDVSKRNWFADAPANIHVHDVHDALLLAKLLPSDAGTPQRFVDIAFPYYSANGEQAGVLGAHLSWSWARQVQRLFDVAQAGQTKAETLIVGATGIVLLGPPHLLGKTIKQASFEAAQGKRPGFSQETWPNGRVYLAGYSKTQGYGDYRGLGWTVLIRQDVDVAYQQVRRVQFRVFAVGLVTAILFSLLGWIAAKRITMPLLKAAEAARSVETGQSDSIDIGKRSYVELDALTGAFNSVLQKLRDKETSLKHINAELERRVSARTDDLARSLAATRGSEARIRTILETAQDAFIGMGRDGRVTDWNPRAATIFGWSQAEVMGQELDQIVIPAALRTAHRHGLQRYLLSGEQKVIGTRLQLTALRRNGEEFPIEMTIAQIDIDGEMSFGAFLNDISERKLIERELEAERAMLTAVLETIDIAVVACDQNGTLTLFNRASREYHGLPLEELAQDEWASHYTLLEQDGVTPMPTRRLPLARALHGELVQNVEMVIAPRGQSARQVLASGRPLADHDGKELGAVVVMSDITERKEAERKLAESERFLLTVTNNSPALIGYADHNEIYRFANQTYTPMMGMNPLTMIGKTLREVMGERPYAYLKPYIGRALAGQRVHFEPEFDIPGWPVHFMSDYIPDIAQDGRVLGFHIMMTNISERKMAELSQAKSEKLAEASSRAKSEFVANMSHEIRTPMNAVLGITQLLAKTPLSSDQKKYLAMIQSSGKSLLGVINDILDFSKIEAGRVDIVAQPFDLNEILDALATTMTASASGRNLELVLGVEPGVSSRFVGDAMHLQQALLNLVGNAVKFTDQGEISVVVALVARAGNQETLRFTVRDTGIGISDEQLARIFAPFEQADSSTSRRFGGTGLGLVISRQLVELMGGGIAVASVVGQGSEFSITIPLQLAPADAAAAAPAGLGAVRLLVVDDNPTTLNYLSQTIHSWNWSAETASSVAAAVEKIRAGADGSDGAGFDVILIDWELQKASGGELLKRARKLAPTVAPLIVTVNAFGQEQMGHAGGGFDGDGVLLKPVTASSLFEAVHAVLLRRNPDLPSAVAPQQAMVRLDGVRLLVVEDNPLNQLVARGMLEPLGALVGIADNGLAAVELLRAGGCPFDTILMDVQMPVMDGYAATEIIRRELGLALPIHAMSAGVMQSERERCLEAGMNDFIPKPIDFDQMVATIAAHLGTAMAVAPVAAPAAAPDMPFPDGVFNIAALLKFSAHHPEQRQTLIATIARAAGQAPRDLQLACAAWQGGDAPAAAATLHALRGAIGSLGATRFAAVALELESAVRAAAHDAIAPLFARAAAEIDASCAAALAWLARQPGAAPDPGSGFERGAFLRELEQCRALLIDHNLDAVPCYQALQGRLHHIYDARRRAALQAAMDGLDFETAHAILAEVQ